MYRVILECDGVPSNEGDTAARHIAQEFIERRPRYRNVTCSFSDGKLTLTAENDFDPKGLALMDEFSDCLSAYISMGFDGDLSVRSATVI
jgi:hypothetical protein